MIGTKHVLVFLMAFSLVASLPVASFGLEQSSKVKVTVTIGALEQFVLGVGGDRVAVTSIAPPSVDPHDVSFDPSMVDEALSSQLVVSSGHVAWEYQLEQLAAERKGVPFSYFGIDLYRDLSGNLTFLDVPGGTGYNIHGYWLLPSNALVIATAIELRLEAIDPGSSAIYRSNLQNFFARVAGLQGLIDSTMSARHLEGAGVAVAFYEEQYLAYSFGLNVSIVLIGEGQEVSPSTLDQATRGFADGSLKAIIFADIVQALPVYQSLRSLSQEGRVPLIPVTVFETAQLPDYVDMMAFDLGSVSSMQGTYGSLGVDQATYLYAIALLAVLVAAEGVIIFSRWKRNE